MQDNEKNEIIVKKSHGRYNYDDVKFESNGFVSLFSYFGGDGSTFAKKHARGIRLLYDKKLKPCTSCSQRLMDGKQTTDHYNWHFKNTEHADSIV